ncbi:hypothetical protein G3569_05190 [Aliifodinibius halophilus]|uniref:6-bladed beta-propeller n=1 Tax=Fodinibius halophilus TaxID=1736908 RepID=A0A6M1T6T4_9BACT|nr:hypothetical protein [Fodinibius halophilus]
MSRNKMIKKIKGILNNPSSYATQKIPIKTNSYGDLVLEGLDENRLILLDTENQELFEYNFRQDSLYHIAEFGRGPGGLSNANDLTIKDDMVYIAMSSDRISTFYCESTPCFFKKETKLNKQIIYSLAKTDSSFVVLGGTPTNQTSGSNLKSTGDKNEPSLHVYNDRKKVFSFGKRYKTNNHWMLKRPFTEGIIKYSNQYGLYILSYSRLPYIYIFNDELELVRSYKFKNFILGKQKYWPKEGRLRIVLSNHSIMKDITLLTKDLALLKVETKRDSEVISSVFAWDRQLDFYLIGLNETKAKYLGSRHFNKKETYGSLIVTKQGVIRSTGGRLKWFNF